MCKVKQQTVMEKLPEHQETVENSSDSDDDSDIALGEDDSDDTTDTDEPNFPPLTPEKIRKIDVNLMMFIIKSYQQVEIVEQKGFMRLSRSMNAGYVMPKRKDISKRILPEMYEKSLEEQKIFVQENAESICLTLDRWEAPIGQRLMSMNAHFITSDFEFRSVLLKVHNCEQNLESLKTVLTETCTEWGISDKINCCVSNDIDEWTAPAINSLGWDHIACMGYKFNTALCNSFQSCRKIIIKVKNIVRYFETSLICRQKLDEYQAKEGVTEPLELCYLDDTNWSCRYEMLDRFVLLKEAVEAILAEQTDILLPGITNDEWTELDQILKLLKPFREITNEMIADKYVSASKIIPIVNRLKQVIHETPECYHLVKKLIQRLDREMNEQFNGIENNTILAMCTILDPRYKTKTFLTKKAADMAKLNLVTEVELLIIAGTGPMSLLKTDDGELNMAIDDYGFELSLRLAEKEVESYLQEELSDEDMGIPPCMWWQDNKSKYPHVAKLFQTRCNIIATSIPTPYIFTVIGIESYDRRNRITPRKAAMTIFLNHNLQDDDYFRLMPENYRNETDQS